jgi:ribosome-binding factor A
MENKRQAKVARLIQKELADYFLKNGLSTFGNSFITVSKVKVTPDLGLARIYLTFLNEKDPQKLLNLVKAFLKEIRTDLASRIKNQVRKIPDLEFYYDDTMDYMEKMEKIFKEIRSSENKEDKGN